MTNAKVSFQLGKSFFVPRCSLFAEMQPASRGDDVQAASACHRTIVWGWDTVAQKMACAFFTSHRLLVDSFWDLYTPARISSPMYACMSVTSTSIQIVTTAGIIQQKLADLFCNEEIEAGLHSGDAGSGVLRRSWDQSHGRRVAQRLTIH